MTQDNRSTPTSPPATRQDQTPRETGERLQPARQTPTITPAETSTSRITPEPKTTPVVTPPTSPTGTPAARDSSTKTYTIKEGDFLITIAEAEYGDGSLWSLIKEANPGLDENRLKIGQQIKIPARPETSRRPSGTTPPATRGENTAAPTTPANKAATGRATYVVESGDTLVKIARKVLGDGKRWREIYELNKDKLESPDVVQAGWELKLPAGSKSTESKSNDK